MKKNGKYRFSLQFGMETKEEIRAGELLEQLGNKKSKVLITALNEYLAKHPELENGMNRTDTSIQGIPMELLELKIKEILNQQQSTTTKGIAAQDNEQTETVNQGLIDMLDDLELF